MGVVVPLSIIIPIIPAVVRYNELSSKLKIISWYLFAGAVTSIVNNVLAYCHLNNMLISHIYTLVEFILLILFYKKIPGEKNKKAYNLLITFFSVLVVMNAAFLESIFTYNSYTKSIEAIVVMFLSVRYFKQNLDKAGTTAVKGDNYIIYINSGLLVYFAGSFLLFIIQNLTVSSLSFGLVMWTIHATFLLVLYILIAIALWKYKA